MMQKIKSFEQLSCLYLKNHPDDVLIDSTWMELFFPPSLQKNIEHYKETGRIKLWVCS